MKWLKAADSYLVRLDQGEEIFSAVVSVATDRRIDLGFVTGIGSASEVTLGYYERPRQEYSRRNLTGDLEIISLSGNISLKDGQPFPHLHVVLSGPDFQAIGGHLFKATVAASCELIIHPLPGMVLRKKDEEAGLFLWDL